MGSLSATFDSLPPDGRKRGGIAVLATLFELRWLAMRIVGLVAVAVLVSGLLGSGVLAALVVNELQSGPWLAVAALFGAPAALGVVFLRRCRQGRTRWRTLAIGTVLGVAVVGAVESRSQVVGEAMFHLANPGKDFRLASACRAEFATTGLVATHLRPGGQFGPYEPGDPVTMEVCREYLAAAAVDAWCLRIFAEMRPLRDFNEKRVCGGRSERLTGIRNWPTFLRYPDEPSLVAVRSALLAQPKP
jgi:hypothetical protein